MQCARPLLLRQPFAPEAIDQVILGCVNVIADEANPARVAALRLGCGAQTSAFTVQINCGSGMRAMDIAYRYIADGGSDLITSSAWPGSWGELRPRDAKNSLRRRLPHKNSGSAPNTKAHTPLPSLHAAIMPTSGGSLSCPVSSKQI